MTSAVDVLIHARCDIGYEESPAGSNRTKFGDWYGANGQPWCAMAISKWFFDAGLPLPASTRKGFAYTPSGAAWFRNQGRWLTSNPQVGDVVFFDFPNDGVSRISHVGIVESVDGGDVLTIEGNTDERGGRTGGKVMRRRRRGGIVGYGRPTYSGSNPDPTPQPPGGDELMWPTVQNGSTGHYAKLVQALLVVHARDLVGDADKFIDGEFGPNSTRVLKTWQTRTNTLQADGVCGVKTWRWLCGVA